MQRASRSITQRFKVDWLDKNNNDQGRRTPSLLTALSKILKAYAPQKAQGEESFCLCDPGRVAFPHSSLSEDEAKQPSYRGGGRKITFKSPIYPAVSLTVRRVRRLHVCSSAFETQGAHKPRTWLSRRVKQWSPLICSHELYIAIHLLQGSEGSLARSAGVVQPAGLGWFSSRLTERQNEKHIMCESRVSPPCGITRKQSVPTGNFLRHRNWPHAPCSLSPTNTSI